MAEPSERRLADQQEVLAAGVGIALWAVALVVLAVFFRHDLQRHHTTWWIWSCGIGLLLGLYGLRTALRRRNR
jgi:membrane protein DedA with SNARE-associated domain